MQDEQQIEQIRQMKYRYFRAVDTHNWALFADCFSADATAAYNSGKLSATGREAITSMISESMDKPLLLTLHQGHHPEIVLLNDREAEGTWHLQDRVIIEEYQLILEGAAIYSDRYINIDGQWLHSHIGYERIFEVTYPFPPGFRISASMFRPADKA